MKLKLSEHFTMPAASLYLFEITMLLILIPIVDRIVYPTLHHFGVNFTPLRKMGVGMLFAVGSVIMAGLMEIERKKYISTHGYFEQHPFNAPVNASQMNIFFQVPQYVLMGIGEVLTSIPGKSRIVYFAWIIFSKKIVVITWHVLNYLVPASIVALI